MEQPESISVHDLQIPAWLEHDVAARLSSDFPNLQFLLSASRHLYCQSMDQEQSTQEVYDGIDHFKLADRILYYCLREGGDDHAPIEDFFDDESSKLRKFFEALDKDQEGLNKLWCEDEAAFRALYLEKKRQEIRKHLCLLRWSKRFREKFFSIFDFHRAKQEMTDFHFMQLQGAFDFGDDLFTVIDMELRRRGRIATAAQPNTLPR